VATPLISSLGPHLRASTDLILFAGDYLFTCFDDAVKVIRQSSDDELFYLADNDQLNQLGELNV